MFFFENLNCFNASNYVSALPKKLRKNFTEVQLFDSAHACLWHSLFCVLRCCAVGRTHFPE